MILQFSGRGKVFMLFAGLMLLSGCATLDKDECLNADWRSIGYEDGARGYAASRIGSHRKACAKHGVAPDFERYEQGRLEGLREYCTPRTGYQLGAGGKPYPYVCPKDLEPAFSEAYQRGKQVHAVQTAVREKERQLKETYSALDAVEKDLAAYEGELVHGSTGPQRRKFLLEEIKILTDDQRTMLADISVRETELDDLRTQLSEMKAGSGF